MLWEEYRKEHPHGYGYTQFCEYLNHHTRIDEAVMHFVHHPAESLQIDFAGSKLGYVDGTTGEWITCEVLVSISADSCDELLKLAVPLNRTVNIGRLIVSSPRTSSHYLRIETTASEHRTNFGD